VNEIFQYLGTFASIFSIPLAIILHFKANSAKQSKVRLEIVRTLSYRIGEGQKLSRFEISAVFNSKIREHNIWKAQFTELIVLEDIITDVVSNPFLSTDHKTIIIQDIEHIFMSYGTKKDIMDMNKPTKIHLEYTSKFTSIAGILAAIMTAVFAALLGDTGERIASVIIGSYFLSWIAAGIIVALISFGFSALIAYFITPKRKKDDTDSTDKEH